MLTSRDTRFDTQDGLYDLAWSEIHQNQIVTGAGDGSLKLWDVTLNVRPRHLPGFLPQLTTPKLGLSDSCLARTYEGNF